MRMGRRPKLKQDDSKIIKAQKFKTPSLLRGMKDILHSEQPYWKFINKKLEELSRKYGYQKIDTPILEERSLFQRALGKQSDIVSKEMICFADPSGSNVCLRSEGSVPVGRAYIKHAMNMLSQPVKMYYKGPMFRYERPQSGRQRIFHQFGFEAIGDDNPILDAQLILICYAFFNELNIKTSLQINSIGCELCRTNYKKEFVKFLKTKKSRLCGECKKKLTKNPLSILDCDEKSCGFVREESPQIVDWLCEECKAHFVKVLEYLDELDIPYELNPYLMREPNYYTKTVFEVWSKIGEDNDIKLAGGGRHNNLIAMLGGKLTPACGFAVGMERLISQYKKHNQFIPQPQAPTVFLAQLGEQAKRKCLNLFEELHKEGIFAVESLARNSLKEQLDLANKLKVKFTLILGQKEFIDNNILLRDMEGGMQEIISFKKIIPELKKKIEEKNKNL